MAKRISSLSIFLGLSADNLRKGTSEASNTLNQFGAKVRGAGAPVVGLQSKLGALRGSMGGFAAGLIKLAGPIAAAVAAFLTLRSAINGITSAFERVDAAAKFAARIGTTIRSLDALSLAAERNGASLGTMQTSLQRMTRRVSEAAMGSGEAVKALDELGLSAKDLAKLTPDQQFERVAEAMALIPNQGDKVRLAMRLFDTEGVALLNTLKAISDSGIAPLREEMKELGSLSAADAAAIEEMNDSWREFKLAIQGVFSQVAATLAPVLNDLLQEILIPMAKAVIALVKGFRELIGVSPDKMAGSMDEIAKSTEAAAAATSTWAEDQKKAAAEMEKLKKAEEELARSAEERAKSAESLINRLKTPIENINDEVREFAKLWFEGLIPIKTAGRAIDDFADRMAMIDEDAAGLSDKVGGIKTPTVGAVRTGTSESIRVVAQLQNAQRDREAESRAEERKKIESALRRERKLEEVRREIERVRLKEPVKVETHKIIG